MNNQLNAKIRICARCERIFIFHNLCPCCAFGSYGAIWAVGFKNTMLGLLSHWFIKPKNKKIIEENKFYE